MKVSLNSLKKYINLDAFTPEEIANKLTFAGIEVEDVTPLSSATNLTVGQVLTCEKMEGSDHLHLTTVDAGKHGVLHIVCGAPNVRKGLKVIVALDGAKLPLGIIHKGKIRGHDSEGMLCSLLELGVSPHLLSDKQKEGIEELPDSFEVGDDEVLKHLGLDDTLLDLKILANRSDIYSIYNLARELETLLEEKANIPSFKEESTIKTDFKVNSLTDNCPQFSIRVIKDIKVKESPKWLSDELRSAGIRSINNIVDIGNYVMLLTGQPLHMYDLDKLSKHELVVRDDIEGEFTALNEKTYELKKGDICICSDDKVMCLGGVMGSLACAVDENTKNVAIEAATFNFASIRRTSVRLNLSSDSSTRFIKGVNPHQYEDVLNLASHLLKELCDAKEFDEIKTYLKDKYVKKVVKTTVKYINDRLGSEFSMPEIVNVLERAFIKVEVVDGELICTIPDWRIDIDGEADLSEEVIRILGFNNVKSELPSMQLSVGGLDENVFKKREVRDLLRGLGLDEQLTYSLVKESEIHDFAFLNKDEAYKIINPLTDEHEYVRTNVLPSLMNALLYNLNHGVSNVSFFEVSDIFSKENKHHIHLGVVLAGNDLRRELLSGENYNFYHIKGILESILNLFNIDSKRVVMERSKNEELHPGKSADVKVDGKLFASMGELHPTTLKKYGIVNLNVVVMELDLGVLFSIKTGAKKMIDISRFPSVKRDFAFVLKDGVSSKDVISEIKKVNREYIKSVDIFDVYKGEHIKDGYYSLAFSVTFISSERTLTDKDILPLVEGVVNAMKIKFNAEQR